MLHGGRAMFKQFDSLVMMPQGKNEVPEQAEHIIKFRTLYRVHPSVSYHFTSA